MARYLRLAYGLAAYGSFLAVTAYLIGFVGDFGVPKTVNAGGEVDGLFALAVDGVLIGLFGLQHSLMAREGFKAWLAEFLPPEAVRPTFVLATAAVLALLFGLWQPIPADIWVVEGAGGLLLHLGFWAGWLVVGCSLLLTGHLEFTGLRQTWSAFRGHRTRPLPFVTRALYRFVRHPMYSGLLMAFWLTPRMTVGHLLFAAGMTGYLLIGMHLEERDLERRFGRRYRAYQRRVPALVPRPAPAGAARDIRRRTV